MQTITELLAQELNCRQEYIANVIALLDEGNTIPFIARYRKEQHGAMDDTTLRTLETRLQYLRNLAQRREEVKASIAAQEKLTDELAKAIDEAATLAEVEDLYRPYKPKRRTRATIAREKGLEPLADAIFAQTLRMDPPEALAAAYIDPDKGVGTLEDALAGASDISPSASPTTRRCARVCVRSCTAAARRSRPRQRRRTRRPPSTGSILISRSPSPACRAIRSWPSTAASARAR